jgi:hypothetical protein
MARHRVFSHEGAPEGEALARINRGITKTMAEVITHDRRNPLMMDRSISPPRLEPLPIDVMKPAEPKAPEPFRPGPEDPEWLKLAARLAEHPVVRSTTDREAVAGMLLMGRRGETPADWQLDWLGALGRRLGVESAEAP